MADRMEKFREMSQNELDIQQRELGEQIFRLRFQLATGQAESVKKLREAKHDLARLKTLVRQIELGQAKAGEGSKSASKQGKAKKRSAKQEKKQDGE